VEEPFGQLAVRQPQCIHRKEKEKNAGREEKAQREEKFTGIALYQQSLFALLPCKYKQALCRSLLQPMERLLQPTTSRVRDWKTR